MANTGESKPDTLRRALISLLHEIKTIRNSSDYQDDRVKLLQTSLTGQINRIDRIELELKKIIEVYAKEYAISPMPKGDDELGIMLAPTAHIVKKQALHDGSLEVSIDGGERFVLPGRLAQVFSFISTGDRDRSGPDALVAWRSRIEIKAYLEKQANKRFKPKHINQLVYRLKNVLRRAGYNPRLIQSSRLKGVRLAYNPGSQASPRREPHQGLDPNSPHL